jgi:hypothetical protein
MKRSLALSLALVALVAFSGRGIAKGKAAPLREEPPTHAKGPRPQSLTNSGSRISSCTTPSPTVVGWWPFDETVGSTADDIAAFSQFGAYGVQQNVGTYGTGSARPTPTANGKVGFALSFDGNDSVTVPDDYEIGLSSRPKVAAPFKFCSGFTIDAWVKTTQSSGVVVIVDKRVNPPAPIGYSLFLYNGQLGFQLADGNPPGSGCGPQGTTPCTNYVALLSPNSPNVANGNWHLIAVTVQVHGSATTCPEVGKLYVDVNGVMTPVLTFVPRTHSPLSTDIANPAALYIGRRPPAFGTPGFFKGLIDELEFYNHANNNGLASDGALTQAQLQAIYTAGSVGKCK